MLRSLLAQILGEWSISSSGRFAPAAIERNLGGQSDSVACHLTDSDVVPHKAPVMTGRHNSHKP